MKISKPKVLYSNAGHYIGTTYYDDEIGCDLPYERLSDYYKNRDDAQAALDSGDY